MPYQNDMSTLADVVGPAYAAQQAGIQNDYANQQEAAKAAVAQGTIGAEIAKPTLANQFTQAQTSNEQGLAKTSNAAGNIAQAAEPSGAQAAVAGNQLKMTADQAQKLGQVGQLAGQAAAYMDNVPAPARPAAMAQLLQSNNIDPTTLGPLASGDPATLRQAADAMAKSSAQFIQESALTGQKVAGEENVAGIGAAGHIQATKELVGGRVDVANIQAQVKQATAPLAALQQQLYTRLTNGTSKDPASDRAMLNNINQTIQQIRQTSLFQQGITGTNAPSTVPPVPTTGGGGGTQAPTGNQPAPTAPDQNAIEAEMRRRGLLK
jgi:hypothetical protein